MDFGKTSKTIIIWRVLLTLVGFLAPLFLIYKPSFPYVNNLLVFFGPRWLHSWAGFDGVHYLTIINKGYLGTDFIQAFFPLYPFLIKFITPAFLNPIITGIVVSTTSLIVALYYLQKLILLDEKKSVAQKTIFLMLLFPTAFFFTAFYTESFFLMLVITSFYFARKGEWLKSGLIAALASATKITGIVLLPALVYEYFLQKKSQKFSLKDIIPLGSISLSSLGLLSYMKYLYTYFSDPLLFLHVQEQFGAGRQTSSLIMLYQVFWRYTKMIFTVQRNSLLFYTVSHEFIIGLSFLILLILAFKHTRKSYALFGLISYILPTLTGTFTSMPRYVLVLFPAFIVLAKFLKGKKYHIFLIISGILLIVNTILFIQGRWVA
jgi:hypothetical protein